MPAERTTTTTTARVEKSGAPDKTAVKGPIVTKVGNLVADPELRFSTAGKAYCRMRLAVSVPVTPGDWGGERQTSFYDVTAFGGLAEHAAESLTKGDRIMVTGAGEMRTWTGDDGTEHQGEGHPRRRARAGPALDYGDAGQGAKRR